jgi:hypothetical protein
MAGVGVMVEEEGVIIEDPHHLVIGMEVMTRENPQLRVTVMVGMRDSPLVGQIGVALGIMIDRVEGMAQDTIDMEVTSRDPHLGMGGVLHPLLDMEQLLPRLLVVEEECLLWSWER